MARLMFFSLDSFAGLTLLGNRLFGPQPQTAVYLCLWEIDIGRITGHTSPEMLATLSRVGKTVGFTFLDKGNSPPANIELAADPDSECFSRVYFKTLADSSISQLLSLRSPSAPSTLPSGLPPRPSTSSYPPDSSLTGTISPPTLTEACSASPYPSSTLGSSSLPQSRATTGGRSPPSRSISLSTCTALPTAGWRPLRLKQRSYDPRTR